MDFLPESRLVMQQQQQPAGVSVLPPPTGFSVAAAALHRSAQFQFIKMKGIVFLVNPPGRSSLLRHLISSLLRIKKSIRQQTAKQ